MQNDRDARDEFSLEPEDARPADQTPGANSDDPHAKALNEAREASDAFLKGAVIWEKRGAMTDAELAQVDLDDLGARLNDFLTGSRRLWMRTDNARKAEKKLHDEAGKAVQAKWNPLLVKLDAVSGIARKLAARILTLQETRAREAAAKAKAEQLAAEERARQAEAAVAQAATVEDKLNAQEIADAEREAATFSAQEVEQFSAPPRLGSATGVASRRALRTVVSARIISQARVLAHYRDHVKVGELLIQLAEAEYRAAPTVAGVKQIPEIPGVEWHSEQIV